MVTKTIPQLLRTGMRFGAEDVRSAEERLATNPALLDDRIGLIGYYFFAFFISSGLADDWIRHVLFLIRDNPSASFLANPHFAAPRSRTVKLEIIADEWLHQTRSHPNDTAVFENALMFFEKFDTAIAELLLERARVFDSQNLWWVLRQSLLLRRKLTSGNVLDPNSVVTRIKELELAATIGGSSLYHSHILVALAECAFTAGIHNESVELAEMALIEATRSRVSVEHSLAMHSAYIVLGRIAAASGSLKGAVQHLLEAGRVRQSRHIIPNMELADELFRLGERQAVAEYLATCANTWDRGRPILLQWIEDIHRDRTPDFLNIQNLL